MKEFLHIVWSVTFIAVTSASSLCPNGWLAYEHSCFFFGFDQKMSFVEAEHFCTQRKGYLVEINDVHENNFITNFVTHMKPKPWWVGLNDMDIEGEWMWLTAQTRPEYTGWYPGQPASDGGHNQDCAMLEPSSGYAWHDAECNSLYQPICEMRSEDFSNGNGVIG